MGAHHFAEDEKSVNRKNSPWFRVNFALAKFQLGEAKEVLIHIRTDKAINLQGFLILFATFSFKKKKWVMDNKKVDFVNYKTPDCRAFLHKENFF